MNHQDHDLRPRPSPRVVAAARLTQDARSEAASGGSSRDDIEAAIAQIRKHGTDADLGPETLIRACHKLWALSYEDEEARSVIAERGGVEAVLGVLQGDDTHVRVDNKLGAHDAACGALCNLAACPANRNMIARLGGVEPVLRMLQSSECAQRGHVTACAALFQPDAGPGWPRRHE